MKQSPLTQEHNQKYNNNMDSKDGINVADQAKHRNAHNKQQVSNLSSDSEVPLPQPTVPKLRPNRFTPAPWYETQNGTTNFELPGPLAAKIMLAVKEFCCPPYMMK